MLLDFPERWFYYSHTIFLIFRFFWSLNFFFWITYLSSLYFSAEIEPRALYTLSNFFANELHIQPFKNIHFETISTSCSGPFWALSVVQAKLDILITPSQSLKYLELQICGNNPDFLTLSEVWLHLNGSAIHYLCLWSCFEMGFLTCHQDWPPTSWGSSDDFVVCTSSVLELNIILMSTTSW